VDIAPPTGPGSRVQELGDRLIIRFRPHRSWGAITVLLVWLTFWTFGGFAAFGALFGADPGERACLLLWLCGWAAGECSVATIIAWQLSGEELLTVTGEQLEVRKEIGRFARSKVYEIARVEDVEAARVPTDEEERSRKDFSLRVSYDDKKIRIGEGMGEREAKYVASVVLTKIRPRTHWGDDPFANWDQAQSAR
jgi:hypothetical protein